MTCCMSNCVFSDKGAIRTNADYDHVRWQRHPFSPTTEEEVLHRIDGIVKQIRQLFPSGGSSWERSTIHATAMEICSVRKSSKWN